MNSLYKYNQNQKATVCAYKNCITVYGETAKIVNVIAMLTAVLIAMALLAKAIR